jgi:hypothetical protein
MLTEETRRRLCEWSGIRLCADDSRFIVPCVTEDCLHIESGGTYDDCERKYTPDYSTWNEVMTLLAKIAERGEWEAFYQWLYDEKWTAGHFDLYLFANFADPSHTAGLVAEWLGSRI